MATWTSAVKDWVTGAVVTESDLDTNVRDFGNAFGPFGTWSPTWTSAGTAPVLNNGTLVAAYAQIQKLVFYHIKLTAGTTTTFGSANAWTFSLPVTAVTGYGTPDVIGNWSGNPAGARSNGVAAISTTSTILLCVGGTTTVVQSAVPGAWASTNVLSISGWYEAA